MKKIITLLALLTLVFLGACSRNQEEKERVEVKNLINKNMLTTNRKRVVGYMPSWAGSAEEIDYSRLTHIIYSFAIPNVDGRLKPLDNEAKLARIVELSKASGVKVSIAIGGWSDNGQELDGRFETLASTSQGRENLVRDIMVLYDKYNLDGVDLDWEYPDPGTSSANYNALMSLLRQELDLRGGLLSAAVMGGITESGQVLWGAGGITDEALAMMDMVNIMAYDSSNGNHSSYDWSINCYRYWNETRQVPSAKINLGVPFYARPSWAGYKTIVAANPQAPYGDYDATYGYYNGIETIKRKTKFVQDNFAGGIMIWEISQDTRDDTSLLKAINDQLGNNNGGQEPTVDELIVVAENELVKLPSTKEEANLYTYDMLPQLEKLVINAEVAVNNAVAKGAVATNIKNHNRLGISKERIVELESQKPVYTLWERGVVYNTGDKVTHNNKNYEAKWWTTNEEPGTTGEWGVWKEIK